MARSPDSVRVKRLNAALALLGAQPTLSEAASELVRRYGMSRRQAYRYLRDAQQLRRPVPAPERKVAFTVKLSEGLIRQVRSHARGSELTLGELVSQALEAFLSSQRRRGR